MLVFALATLTLFGAWMIASEQETVSADPKPPVAAGCFIFGVPDDECPNGALIVEDVCGIPEVAQTTPSSQLSTYSDYLDTDAILNYPGGPYPDLISGVQAPGGIKLIVTPGAILNIQCEFDVSEFLKDDRPKGALVTEFICGPFFDPAKNGTSRLTPNGKLLVNCSWHDFPAPPPF